VMGRDGVGLAWSGRDGAGDCGVRRSDVVAAVTLGGMFKVLGAAALAGCVGGALTAVVVLALDAVGWLP
jgi:hypothetical protein